MQEYLLDVLESRWTEPDEGIWEIPVRELMTDSDLVLRYRTEHDVDDLPGDEGAFLACSFWLVEALHLPGQKDRARALVLYQAGRRCTRPVRLVRHS